MPSQDKKLEVKTLPETAPGITSPKEVIDKLKQAKEIDVPWNNDPEKIAEELAKKIEKEDEKQKTAKEIILAAMGEAMSGSLNSLQRGLEDNGCKFVKLDGEQLTFYKAKPLTEANAIKEKDMANLPPLPDAAEKPAESAGSAPEAPKTPKAPPETSSAVPKTAETTTIVKKKPDKAPITAKTAEKEEQDALQDFKKYFPDAKISTTETVAVGANGNVVFTTYEGALPVLYQESGKKILTYDDTGAKKASAEIKKPFVIEALNPHGIKSKYVYADLKINGSIQNGIFSGWIELGRLKKGKERFATDKKESDSGASTEQEAAKTPLEKKKEEIEATFKQRSEDYGKKFEAGREKAKQELEPKLHSYVETKFLLKPEVVKLINNEETWRAAWNEETVKGVSGLDKLIRVLKDPVFIKAGVTEANAREKMLELIKIGRDDRVDMEDILNVFEIYRDKKGDKGSFSDFKKEVEQNKGQLKAVENNLDIIKKVETKKKQALAEGYLDKQGHPNPFALCTPEEVREFNRAAKLLFDSGADDRTLHLNYVLTQGASLIEALRGLGVKEFTPDKSPVYSTAETQRVVASLRDVFYEAQRAKISWEDTLAEQGFDRKDISSFGGYFDRKGVALRIRSRLHSYTDAKGVLDGVERVTEAQTVDEYNRLMEKGLRRLAIFKGKKALELYQKYAEKPDITDEDALFTAAMARLQIKKLEDLSNVPEADAGDKQLLADRKDLIKMGFYLDERDREIGITPESKETVKESAYSKNPLIYLTQKKLVAAGYPKDLQSLKEVENKMLGAGAIKLDVGTGKMDFGAGTAIDLGNGWKILLGLGYDQANKSALVGIGIRKEIKTGEETKLGVTAGPVMAVPGITVGLGANVDFTFPIGETTDMSVFGGMGIGYLGLTAGGGVMISGNAERAIKESEKEALGMDDEMWKNLEKIDNTSDPDQKYLLISQDPLLKQLLGPILNDSALTPDQKQLVALDSYKAMREQLHDKALEKTETPGVKAPILHQLAEFLGGEFRVTGAGIVVGTIKGVPYAGPIFTVEIGRKVLVYPRASTVSYEAKSISESKVHAVMKEKLQKEYPGLGIEFKEIPLGKSDDIMVDKEGTIMVLQKKQEIDLTALKGTPQLEKYNKMLKPLNMKFEVDGETGFFELKIYDTLGNIKLMVDPGMEHKGLILRDNKVFLATGAKPELFISREEFFTPFPKKGSARNILITISDTPERKRSEIEKEIDVSGAYLYKKAGMEWELMFAPEAKKSNTVNFETYKEHAYWFETSKEEKKGQSFDKELFEEYLKKLKEIPFIKEYQEYEVEKSLVERVAGKKSFAEKFLEENQKKYRELTTLKGDEKQEKVAQRLRELVNLLQKKAKGKKTAGGMERELNDLEVNAVISKLMDLSFSELEKAGDAKERRARFEKNLTWSKKAVLIPFFAEKIPQTVINRGKSIASTPEELADRVEKILLENVKGDPSKADTEFLKDPKFTLSAVAGTLKVEGLRGVPYYLQKEYGISGKKEHKLSKEDDVDSDLASIILEMESPMNTKTFDEFQRSPLVRKLIAMPGLWVVLGNAIANEMLEKPAKSEGWNEFEKIVKGIREAQHNGKNIFSYTNTYGNTYEFRIDTKVISGAHARCGNPLFGAREDIQIYALAEKQKGIIVAVGSEKTATVSPQTTVETTSIGLAGVITATSREEAAPAPGEKPIPTPKEEAPPVPTPAPNVPPAPAPKPAPGVGGVGGKTSGGTTASHGGTTEGSAGL